MLTVSPAVPWCPQARPVPGSPAGLRSLAGPVLQRGAPAEPRAVHLPGVHGAGGHHPPHQFQGTAPLAALGLGAALCSAGVGWELGLHPRVMGGVLTPLRTSISNLKAFKLSLMFLWLESREVSLSDGIKFSYALVGK